MDCNPAILVGKKPQRLAAQESPRCGGGAGTCTSAEEFQPRFVEELALIVRLCCSGCNKLSKKKMSNTQSVFGT